MNINNFRDVISFEIEIKINSHIAYMERKKRERFNHGQRLLESLEKDL